MDNLLTQTLCIKNHPICELKEKFRVQYVMGLGEFMYYISKKDQRAKFVFEVWVRSIVGHLPASSWQCTTDCSQIRIATSLKRDGVRFFSMRRIFFFDCLYLASILDPKLLTYTNSFLHNHVRGLSRQILQDVYSNWGEPFQKNIPTQLLNYQKINEAFHCKPLKKILVVATMNAGKSTLINALMGRRVNAVKATACTSKLCYLYNKPFDYGIVAKCDDGSLLYSDDVVAFPKDDIVEVGLHFHSSLSDSRVCLVDSPGTNYSGDDTHREITQRAISSNDYDAIIFVVNSLQFNTDDEASLRDFVFKHSTKPIIFVLNKLDCFNLEDDSILDTMNSLEKSVGIENKRYKIVPLSAYYALLLKMEKQNKRLSKQEQIQLNRLKSLFQHDYYNLAKYFDNSNGAIRKIEIEKTGILILESLIKTL